MLIFTPMSFSCPSGKTAFVTESLAVDSLLEVWSRTPFRQGDGPVTVYQCGDCGRYHFTSKGEIHPDLKDLLDSGTIERSREAAKWEEKFRRS